MQPAELQERGPPSQLSPFFTPQEKLFIFPWQPLQQTPASNKLELIPGQGTGEERRGDEEIEEKRRDREKA